MKEELEEAMDLS